jgi:hypothetical protein
MGNIFYHITHSTFYLIVTFFDSSLSFRWLDPSLVDDSRSFAFTLVLMKALGLLNSSFHFSPSTVYATIRFRIFHPRRYL